MVKAMARKILDFLRIYVLIGVIVIFVVLVYMAATIASGYYFIGVCIMHASNEICINCGCYTFIGITLILIILIKIIERWQYHKKW